MILRWSLGKLNLLYIEVLEREDDETPDSAALEVYNERAPESMRAVPDERRRPSLGSITRPTGAGNPRTGPIGFSRQP